MVTNNSNKHRLDIRLKIEDPETKLEQEIKIELIPDKKELWKEDFKKILNDQEGKLTSIDIVEKKIAMKGDEFIDSEEVICLCVKNNDLKN